MFNGIAGQTDLEVVGLNLTEGLYYVSNSV